MTSFYAKWLQDYEDAQCPGKPGCPGGSDHGALSSTIPFAKHTPPVDLTWPTSYLQIAMLVYKYSGDAGLIRARYDSMKRFVDYLPTPRRCSACRPPTSDMTHAPGHPELPWYYMNGDWMEYQPISSEESESGPILSSYHYIVDVGLLSQMAQLLGKLDDASKYGAMATKLWESFHQVYLTQDEKAGRFRYATPGQPGGQAEQAAMLGRAGVPVPPEHRQDVEQTLLQKLAEAGQHVTTGLVGTKYVWPALSGLGRADLALEMAIQTSCPSYGYQVNQGATTLWENWSGNQTFPVRRAGVGSSPREQGAGPSHNHHFLGSIGQWLQSDLVGLNQGDGTAFSRPVIAPRIVNHTDLPAASGHWYSPRGLIAVSWKYDAASLRLALNVSTPPNTEAAVLFSCRTNTIYERGIAVWHNGTFRPRLGIRDATLQSAGIAGMQLGLVLVRIGGGQYEFHGVCS